MERKGNTNKEEEKYKEREEVNINGNSEGGDILKTSKKKDTDNGGRGEWK